MSLFVMDYMQTLRGAKLAEIKRDFNNRHKSGHKVTLGITMDCAQGDVIHLERLYQITASNPDNSLETLITIRDFHNQFHQVTLEQLGEIIDELITRDLDDFQLKWQLEQQVADAQTEEDLQGIHWRLQWPISL